MTQVVSYFWYNSNLTSTSLNIGEDVATCMYLEITLLNTIRQLICDISFILGTAPLISRPLTSLWGAASIKRDFVVLLSNQFPDLIAITVGLSSHRLWLRSIMCVAISLSCFAFVLIFQKGKHFKGIGFGSAWSTSNFNEFNNLLFFRV